MTPDEPVQRGDGVAGLGRHGAGFIVSGGLAFATDASILALLHHGLGFDPFLVRPIAIGAAMIVAWCAHRRLTFNVTAPPSFREFMKFAGVASSAAILNYAVFAATLIVRPQTEPLAALIGATAVAMVASYFSMRFGVFDDAGKDAEKL